MRVNAVAVGESVGSSKCGASIHSSVSVAPVIGVALLMRMRTGAAWR